MRIFNVGLLEIVFIFLLALIVLGPRKAIETAGDIGRWLNKLMKSQFWKELMITSREIQDLPRKIMNESEIQTTIKELNHAKSEIQEMFVEEGYGPVTNLNDNQPVDSLDSHIHDEDHDKNS